MSCPGAFFFGRRGGNLLILNTISQGEVDLAGKDIGRG